MERTVTASTRTTPSIRGGRSLTRLFAAGALLVAGASSAAAPQITVYRCIDAGGGVALQDQPCPPGREAARRSVRAEADSAPVEDPPPAPAAAPANAAPVDFPDLPAPPPPELWLCVDFEGKQRFAPQAEPNGRYLPVWVVSGNEAGPRGIAGRGGRPAPRAGGSGPGGPVNAVPGALGPMVYVEDRCFLLPPEQACRRYREQREEIERKRPSRSGDERRQMEADSTRLLGILRASCP